MADHAGLVATPILQNGPFVDIVVAPIRGALAGLTARGLIDTGADDVLISHSIAKTLKLRHVGDETLNGVGGQELDEKLYGACIRVLQLGFDRVLPVCAVDWDQVTHTVLLGRSFLRYFVFRYDGPSQVFHFSKPID